MIIEHTGEEVVNHIQWVTIDYLDIIMMPVDYQPCGGKSQV